MYTKQIKIADRDMNIVLNIHTIDNEESEVYAMWDGMELERTDDQDSMIALLEYKYGPVTHIEDIVL